MRWAQRRSHILADAERYEPDAYGVYGALPVNKHVVGEVRGDELARRVAFEAAREVE